MPRTYATKPNSALRFWKKNKMRPPRVDVAALVRRRLDYVLANVPPSPGARAADRLRYDLARRLHNLQKTLEPAKSQVDCHPGPASPGRAQAQDKSGHDEGENAEQA
jgi:hypothetical protein